MKIIKIIGHPVLVMSLFLLLLISGEAFGGFYVIYVLLGLSHGVPHALLATGGLGCMLTGYKIYRRQIHPIKPALYVIGNALMILALVTFFSASKGYNDPTFHQTIPLTSFILFGLCMLCNLILSGNLFIRGMNQKDNNLKVAS